MRLRLALLPRGRLGSAFSRHSLRLGTNNNKGSRIARRFAPSLELYLSRPTQPAIFCVTSNKQRSSVKTWPVFGFFATPRLFRDASVLQPMRWVGSWWCPLRTPCNERRGCPIQDRRCSLRSPLRATSRPPKPTLLQRLRATFSAQATRWGRFDFTLAMLLIGSMSKMHGKVVSWEAQYGIRTRKS